MKSSDFRPLSDRERQALRTMLAVEFRDHQRLAEQVSDLALRQRDETLFELAPTQGRLADSQPKTFAIPVESTYRDKDGEIVYVDLFVDEHDALVELEIWKPDGSDVETYFADAELSVKPADVKARGNPRGG
jgi:hypothetical protein